MGALPATEGLMVLLGARGPVHETSSRRKQGNVLPVEILEQSVRGRGKIGKPADERGAFTAYTAYSAFFLPKFVAGLGALSRQGIGRRNNDAAY